jgi:hypothetical protein
MLNNDPFTTQHLSIEVIDSIICIMTIFEFHKSISIFEQNLSNAPISFEESFYIPITSHIRQPANVHSGIHLPFQPLGRHQSTDTWHWVGSNTELARPNKMDETNKRTRHDDWPTRTKRYCCSDRSYSPKESSPQHRQQAAVALQQTATTRVVEGWCCGTVC